MSSKTEASLGSALAAALGLILSSQAAAAPACPNAGWVIVEPKASPETRPVKAGGNHTIFVRRTQITTTPDLTGIKLAGDAYDTQVQLNFTAEAARRLHDATANQDGLHIAFVVDNLAMSAVTWTGSYGMDADQGVQLSLGKPVPRVRRLVDAIQACLRSNGKPSSAGPGR